MAQLNFDASTVDPDTGRTPMPAGRYTVQIVESEMKSTKSGTGEYLALVLEVADGEFKGRKIFENLNIVNQNVTAQEIALKTLSAICRACGLLGVSDSTELHYIPIDVELGIEPERPNGAGGVYEARNSVKRYYFEPTAVAGSDAPPRPPTAKPAAPPPAAAKAAVAGRRPWEK
jgi:hypothetical protein